MMCPRQVLEFEWKFSKGLLQVHLIRQGPSHHQHRYLHPQAPPRPACHWKLMNLDLHPDFSWPSLR
uniref:Uncharacterized protein n=1 Tax=Arundo donax TaxID=35708 RepID=A0A0A8Y0P5_ARUDO